MLSASGLVLVSNKNATLLSPINEIDSSLARLC